MSVLLATAELLSLLLSLTLEGTWNRLLSPQAEVILHLPNSIELNWCSCLLWTVVCQVTEWAAGEEALPKDQGNMCRWLSLSHWICGAKSPDWLRHHRGYKCCTWVSPEGCWDRVQHLCRLYWGPCVFWDLVLFKEGDVIRFKRETDLPVSWNLSVGTCTPVVKNLQRESGLWKQLSLCYTWPRRRSNCKSRIIVHSEKMWDIQHSHFLFHNEETPWFTVPCTYSFENTVRYGCFIKIPSYL